MVIIIITTMVIIIIITTQHSTTTVLEENGSVYTDNSYLPLSADISYLPLSADIRASAAALFGSLVRLIQFQVHIDVSHTRQCGLYHRADPHCNRVGLLHSQRRG